MNKLKTDADTALVETVARIARTMREQAGGGPLSAGEVFAGALLNNRLDWLPSSYDHPIDAIERLGPRWWKAVVEAHRQGWATSKDESAATSSYSTEHKPRSTMFLFRPEKRDLAHKH